MRDKPSLDFSKVESLRRHMLLTAENMAELFGVSRVTYFHWVKGKPIRAKNCEHAKAQVRKLLNVMQKHSWPTPEVIAAPSQKERFEALKELLQQD